MLQPVAAGNAVCVGLTIRRGAAQTAELLPRVWYGGIVSTSLFAAPTAAVPFCGLRC